MKRIFTIVLSLLTVLVCFSGCSKEATSSVTTSELVEKYAEPIDGAEVWLYDSGENSTYDLKIEEIQGTVQIYNESNLKFAIDLKIFDNNSLGYEQFQQKLQASLMSGNGPDLIISRDPNLLTDVVKITKSGALKSFDEIIASWDKEMYYPEVLNGVRSDDGKVYVLPISYSPDIISTTSELLARYGVTENDFDDFNETTQTIIKIGEQLTEQPEIVAEWTSFTGTRWVPSVYDIEEGKTALMTDAVQLLMTQWKNVYDLRLPHYPLDGDIGLARVAIGCQVLAIEPLDYMQGYLQGKPQTEQERYLYLPMRDVDGYMTGTIGYYAVMPRLGDHDENIAAYLNQILFASKGYMPGSISECWLSKQCQSNNGLGIAAIDKLSEEQMRLRINNQTLQDIDRKISDLIWSFGDPEKNEDWEELERSINIYLSE